MCPGTWNSLRIYVNSANLDADDRACQEREHNEIFSRLLIYEDEREIIMKTFEVMMRPILRDEKRLDSNLIICGLWRYMRLHGITAD